MALDTGFTLVNDVGVYGYNSGTGQWEKLTSTNGKLDVEATLTVGDIEIGAVELKDGGSDARAPVSATDGLLVNLGANNDVTTTISQTTSGVAVYGSDDGGTTKRIIKTDSGGAIQVDLEVASVAITSIAAGDNNIGNVDVASSALPTGAATEATLATIDADTGTIAGAVSGTEMQVDVVTQPALASGTDSVTVHGSVGAMGQTTLGTSQIVAGDVMLTTKTFIAGDDGGANIQDAKVTQTGPTPGMMSSLATHSTIYGSISGTPGAVSAVTVGGVNALTSAIVDGSGNQVTSFGGTQYADGAADPGPSTGTVALGTDSTNLQALRTSTDGRLQTELYGNNGGTPEAIASNGSGGLKVQLADGAVLASVTQTGPVESTTYGLNTYSLAYGKGLDGQTEPLQIVGAGDGRLQVAIADAGGNTSSVLQTAPTPTVTYAVPTHSMIYGSDVGVPTAINVDTNGPNEGSEYGLQTYSLVYGQDSVGDEHPLRTDTLGQLGVELFDPTGTFTVGVDTDGPNEGSEYGLQTYSLTYGQDGSGNEHPIRTDTIGQLGVQLADPTGSFFAGIDTNGPNEGTEYGLQTYSLVYGQDAGADERPLRTDTSGNLGVRLDDGAGNFASVDPAGTALVGNALATNSIMQVSTGGGYTPAVGTAGGHQYVALHDGTNPLGTFTNFGSVPVDPVIGANALGWAFTGVGYAMVRGDANGNQHALLHDGTNPIGSFASVGAAISGNALNTNSVAYGNDGGTPTPVHVTATGEVEVVSNGANIATESSLATVAGAVSGTEMQVDVVTSALPTGAATEATLLTIDADTGTIAGAVSGTEMQVDVVAALPAGDNNIGNVDVLSIAAGDNNIGNVDIASIAAGDNNIGNVDVITLPSSIQGPGNPTVDSYSSVALSAAANTADQSVVAAPGASKQIWVYGYQVTADTGAGSFAFQDEDNTALTGVMAVAQYGGVAVSPSGNFAQPLFKVATNKALEIDTVTCGAKGTVQYAIVSV